MFLSYRRARRAQTVELNITAFMNLMVALVPFLLITAVFTQMAILELNLPEASESKSAEPPPQALTVIIRPSAITLFEGARTLRSLPSGPQGYNLAALAEALSQVKGRRPAEDKITLLLEADTPYDTLIQVMDTVRVYPDGGETQREMFPAISLGDAPPEGRK